MKRKMTLQKPAVKPKPLPTIKDYGPNAIEINGLTYAYNKSGSALVSNNVKNVLQGLNLTLETGSRCLLIGANGRYVIHKTIETWESRKQKLYGSTLNTFSNPFCFFSLVGKQWKVHTTSYSSGTPLDTTRSQGIGVELIP